jgi:hypothetical protein
VVPWGQGLPWARERQAREGQVLWEQGQVPSQSWTPPSPPARLPLVLGLLPISKGASFLPTPDSGCPPMDAPFSAAAFLRGQSPPPVTVATADSALVAALAAARTEAAAA